VAGTIQKIRISDAVSKDIKVTSSVPQGSHLGPLCFIWFFNRKSEIFDYVRVLFYADDMKLFLLVSGFQDYLKIQSDMNKLSEGCDNVGKCKTIKFARSRHPVRFLYMMCGTVLDRVSSINDLGVIMDEKMTFSTLKPRKGGLFDMLCVVWVGCPTCMVCHRMRTDSPFCILKPLEKGDRLLV
jgi:hypothetical protein